MHFQKSFETYELKDFVLNKRNSISHAKYNLIYPWLKIVYGTMKNSMTDQATDKALNNSFSALSSNDMLIMLSILWLTWQAISGVKIDTNGFLQLLTRRLDLQRFVAI